MCIAVVQPLVTGVEGQADSVATSVRNLFVSFLTGPSMKAVPLEARLASQAAEEARERNCTRVLTMTLEEKHHGNHQKLAGLTHAAGTAAGYMPYSGPAGAVAAGAAIGGSEAVSAVAYQTRSKDEMTLGYSIATADGRTILPRKTDKATAHTDGEDLITPLVAKAADVIAAAVGKQ
ncbi:MAG TPA: hypothetical protein VGL62_09675 [Vicinamibacterales bacterium]